MKYEQTPEDLKIIEHDLKTNRTLQHLRDINYFKFSVGDVLIREDKYGDTWKVKTAHCGLPYKYVYAFENDLGVGYIRRLSVNGRKYVENPICVVYFDPLTTRFSLDPSFANHILLSGEDDAFDTKSEYAEAKKRREQMHRKNKKMAEPITNEADAMVFLKKIKVGDQFWWGWNASSISKNPVYVTDINTSYGVVGNCYLEWSYYPPNQSTFFTKHKLNVNQLQGALLFLSKPLFPEDIVS